MINEKEIEEAKIKSRPIPTKVSKRGWQNPKDKVDIPTKNWLKHDIAFMKGVKFAESKIEEIAIEFYKWISKYYLEVVIPNTISLEDYKKPDIKELFKQFIKQRND